MAQSPAPSRGAAALIAARHLARRTLVDVHWLISLFGLPGPVVWFQLRARRLARRSGDTFSLTSVTRPPDLRLLLSVAQGRRRVVELGTATGWTAISLALADPERQVLSCDVVARSEPQRYLGLVGDSVRARVQLAIRPGSDGPVDDRDADLLYIDSSHEREQTIAEVRAWRAALAPGAIIVFDDFTHPDFPGVREAVSELGLAGDRRGTLFIHRVSRASAGRP
ncbi:MAG TPA: class I SAM-dependent methyltransferase [Solirubrobacteraceae bacterium]|nr:class I SAM-dependent methyltransferase [Solirubrobacteraceae bacterium]